MRNHSRFASCVRLGSIAIQPLASVSASTRSDVADPIILNGFVPAKVQRHFNQTWPPCESLGEKQATVAAPVHAISRARRYCLAAQLVPTIATIAVPRPNPSGSRMYSRRAPHAAPIGTSFPKRPGTPADITTDKFVMSALIKARPPTLQGSAD